MNRIRRVSEPVPDLLGILGDLLDRHRRLPV
jgi:hypothetical protein